jgi:hypothetical protein
VLVSGPQLVSATCIRQLNAANEPCSCPRVRVVPLIPVDEGSASSDARVGGPGSAQDDVVLAIEEVTRISRVQVHGLESLELSQWRAGPFCRSC